MQYKTQLATTLPGVNFLSFSTSLNFRPGGKQTVVRKTTCLHIHGFYVLGLRCFQRNSPESVYHPPTVLSQFCPENFE